MMSDSSDAFDPSKRGAPDEPDQPDAATDDLEGSSTEVDGEAPHERTVAGEPASEQHPARRVRRGLLPLSRR